MLGIGKNKRGINLGIAIVAIGVVVLALALLAGQRGGGIQEEAGGIGAEYADSDPYDNIRYGDCSEGCTSKIMSWKELTDDYGSGDDYCVNEGLLCQSVGCPADDKNDLCKNLDVGRRHGCNTIGITGVDGNSINKNSDVKVTCCSSIDVGGCFLEIDKNIGKGYYGSELFGSPNSPDEFCDFFNLQCESAVCASFDPNPPEFATICNEYELNPEKGCEDTTDAYLDIICCGESQCTGDIGDLKDLLEPIPGPEQPPSLGIPINCDQLGQEQNPPVPPEFCLGCCEKPIDEDYPSCCVEGQCVTRVQEGINHEVLGTIILEYNWQDSNKLIVWIQVEEREEGKFGYRRDATRVGNTNKFRFMYRGVSYEVESGPGMCEHPNIAESLDCESIQSDDPDSEGRLIAKCPDEKLAVGIFVDNIAVSGKQKDDIKIICCPITLSIKHEGEIIVSGLMDGHVFKFSEEAQRLLEGNIREYSNGCVESDSGNFPYAFGTISGIGEYEDYCSGNSVVEYYCLESGYGTQPFVDRHDCPSGCSDGRCNLSPSGGNGDGSECVSYHHKGCFDGNLYWYDSCDNLGTRLDLCSGDEVCVENQDDAECCVQRCENEGARQCHDTDWDKYQICADCDDDPCREWCTEQCTSPLACQDGKCV